MPAPASTKPYELTFDPTFIDFGEVRRGDQREQTFHFQNTGTKPVEIDLVTSCDCTTLTWPEAKQIMPGEKGTIHAVFDSSEKEKSETVDIDIILVQSDPVTDYPIVYTLQYKFELLQ